MMIKKITLSLNNNWIDRIDTIREREGIIKNQLLSVSATYIKYTNTTEITFVCRVL